MGWCVLTMGEAAGLGGLAGGGVLGGAMMAAGVALLTAMAVIRYRKKLRRVSGAGSDRRSPREKMDAVRERAEARGSIDSLMVEAQELTRVCAAQMENRATRLEQLIREADEKIAELRRLEGAAGGAGRPEVVTREVAGASGSSDPLAERVCELASAGKAAVEIARELDEATGKVELILALSGRGTEARRHEGTEGGEERKALRH